MKQIELQRGHNANLDGPSEKVSVGHLFSNDVSQEQGNTVVKH
jgi:hypothetical protein